MVRPEGSGSRGCNSKIRRAPRSPGGTARAYASYTRGARRHHRDDQLVEAAPAAAAVMSLLEPCVLRAGGPCWPDSSHRVVKDLVHR